MATTLFQMTMENTSADSLSSPKVLIDNDTTRLTFYRIKPGQQSGWHRHEHNYVGYHFQSCDVRVDLNEGASGSIESREGKATFYDVGGGLEHNVAVVGDTDLVALEID